MRCKRPTIDSQQSIQEASPTSHGNGCGSMQLTGDRVSVYVPWYLDWWALTNTRSTELEKILWHGWKNLKQVLTSLNVLATRTLSTILRFLQGLRTLGCVSARKAALQIEIEIVFCRLDQQIIQTEHYISTFDCLLKPIQDLNTEPTMTWTSLPSNTDLEDLWNEAEDSPRRSKRVAIRHSSVWVGSHTSQA